MEMNEQLLEVVRKNLPETTAGELKKFIELANADKQALANALSTIEQQKPLLIERTQLLNEKQEIALRESKVSSREEQLEINEQKLKLSEKDQEIKALTTIKDNMFTIMQLFVKNPRSIEIMQHSNFETQAPYLGGGGQTIYPAPINRMETKTTEHKQEKEL